MDWRRNIFGQQIIWRTEKELKKFFGNEFFLWIIKKTVKEKGKDICRRKMILY